MREYSPRGMLNGSRTDRSRLDKAAVIYLSLLLLVSIHTTAYAAGGTIDGTVIDEGTGEPLVGVTVMLEGTTMGAKTNLDGKYTIKNVTPGTYVLLISSVGYESKRIEEVAIAAKKTESFDVQLAQTVVEGKTVTVKGKMIQGTEAALLTERQKATVVSDAISANTISRTGSGDAAEAVTQVTGASVVGGKYVYVRGLGGRYSNTLLNGAPIPNADPDQHAVHMDLIPAKMLDKVVVKKTFTPDQIGSFSGGSVDIGTRSMPTGLTMSFSQSSGYSSRATGNDKFLSYQGGDTDWLGIDDGTRDLPSLLADPAYQIPRYSRARNDRDQAYELDAITKSFNPVMTPTAKRAPINQGYAFSFGNRYDLGDETPLGVLASLTYSYKTKYYDDGLKNRWKSSSLAPDTLEPYYTLGDRKGAEEVLWGGLAGLSLEPGTNHKLNLNFMYNRNSESTARYLSGSHYYEFQGDDRIYEIRSLKFTERFLGSLQLSGEHFFPLETASPSRLQWKLSYSENNKNTPDLRKFTDVMVVDPDTSFITQASGIASPARWFGEMQERKKSVSVDFSQDFKNRGGNSSKLKLGVLYEQTRRENRERRFKYTRPTNSSVVYNGNPDEFFGPEGTGIVDSTFRREETVYIVDTIDADDGSFVYDTVGSYVDSVYRYEFGNVVEYNLQEMRMANYDGEQTIVSSYVMIEYPITRRLQIIGGGRAEITDMDVANMAGVHADLNDADFLPSLNIIYQLKDNMNVRLAAARTLARPIFREKMPLVTYEFDYDYKFRGNPDLERTLISNYDLRWEYFIRPGEIFAVSGYYKYFDKPITRFIVDINGNLEPRNVEYGKLYGLEFEFKSRMDRLANVLRNFTLAANVSFINSEIKVGDDELELALSEDSTFSATRDMQGQSPYIVNVDLSFSSNGTTATLLYNVFGERMTEVALAAVPDVYEQPFHSLNFNASQRIYGNFKISFSASNILNEAVRKTQTHHGIEYTESEYRYGRNYSIGSSYGF